MKARVCKVTSLIVAFLVAVFSVGYAFAWLVNRRDAELNINGSSQSAYFAGGNGSAEYPYLITNYVHMRNLAVLQNTGRLVDRNKEPCKYYFAVMNDVDMSGMYIPPIGNDKYPFIGDFNGNGHTISAVQVTTDKSLLKVSGYTIQSGSEYQFSQAVGLFGMTGSESVIKNFILDEPTVEVANTENEKTAYLTAATDVDGKTVTPASKTVGLAVGHVEGKCSSIGVRTADKGAALNVDIKGYSTFNSILGELGEGVQSSVTGGGYGEGSGGSGSSFGASFDVASMRMRLLEIEKNKQSDTPSFLLPDLDDQNNDPVPIAGEKIPFSIANFKEENYVGANAIEEVSDNNIGYFLGNQNKFDEKNIVSVPAMTLVGNEYKVTSEDGSFITNEDGEVQKLNNKGEYQTLNYYAPNWFYKYTTASGDYNTDQQSPNYLADCLTPLTNEEFYNLPQEILNLLPANVGDTKEYTAIKLSQTFTNNPPQFSTDNAHWSYHGQISYMGKTYGKGFRAADGTVVNEQGDRDYLEEVDYGWGSITRIGDMYDNYGQPISFNNYTGGVLLPNSAIWFKPARAGKLQFVMWAEKADNGFTLVQLTRVNANAENPFYVETNEWGGLADGNFTYKEAIKARMPAKVFLYYEIDISEEEVAAGNVEYMLMQYGQNGAHFLYLDIGASAAEDESGVADDKAVSAIDFIYDGVSISKEEDADKGIKIGDFIVSVSGSAALYEASKTSIYFENTQSVLNIVFIRLNGRDDKKTLDISNSSPVPSRTGEVKATVPTYVIPDVGSGS